MSRFATVKKTSCTLITTILLLSAFCSALVHAEPWIDTSDIYLKSNIQALADAGYITTPVTTYPLMWKDVIRDVNEMDITKLTITEQSAHLYIKQEFARSKRYSSKIKAQTSSKNTRFTSFGDHYREKNSFTLQYNVMNEYVAAKISTGYVSSADGNDQKIRLDDSYVAVFLGNWALSYGKQNSWYSSTWDSSLSLSNNARPLPALTLSRQSAEPFTLPFTDIEIPWTLSTFMGKMDDNRSINNALLWGFRLNLKPTNRLEIGFSRVAQWGGDGRDQSLSAFWDVFLGKSNCGIDGVVCDENTPNPANQQAGFDFRYALPWVSMPVNIYFQKFFEDGSEGSFNFVTKGANQAGIDTYINLFSLPSTLFLEYTDSFMSCPSDGPLAHIGDCYYEHSAYSTGMRYHGRTISNLYDNDSQSIILGMLNNVSINTQVTTKLRILSLNSDNSDKAPDNPIIGNPLTSIPEDMIMLSGAIKHTYNQWRFTLATDVSESSFIDPEQDKVTVNASFMLEYQLQ